MPAPLADRLRLPAAGEILVLNAPEEVLHALGDPAVAVHEAPAGVFAFVMAFVPDRAAAAAALPTALNAFDGEGMLWVAYPKRSSRRYASDLDRDLTASLLGPFGYEPVAQIAVDDDWSALRFRRTDRIPRMTRSFAYSEEGRRRIGGKPG